MSRTVTAIYRTADVADLVKREIEQLGVASHHVSVVGGADNADDVGHFNLPHDEAVTYREAVRQGHYVVSAEVDDDRTDKVAEIMRDPEGGVDIDSYEQDYRTRDTYNDDLDTYGTGSPAYGGTLGRPGTVEDGNTVELAEERLSVGKRDIDRGTTHVRTYVQEVPVEERIRLREEHVSVDRRTTGERVVTGAEADALFEERDIAVTEHDEEAVVSKEAVVTEEIVISKDVEEREEVVHDTVRKTEVDINRNDVDKV